MSPTIDPTSPDILNRISEEAEKFQNGNEIELLPDEAIEEAPQRFYDADAVQIVNVNVPRGAKNFNVKWKMNPLTDETYFRMMEQVPEQIKRIRTASPEVLMPLADIGRALAVERIGYKPNPNWREKTHPYDLISAVVGLTDVDFYFEGVTATDEELLDDDAEVPIKLSSAFDGEEIITTVYFREESKDQMDEYFAIMQNQPRKNVLASAKKTSKERRMYELYKELNTRAEGYTNRVPAWHAIKAVEGFLQLQIARLGKLPNGLQAQ